MEGKKEKYVFGKELGYGASGTVYVAENEKEKVAVKKISVDSMIQRLDGPLVAVPSVDQRECMFAGMNVADEIVHVHECFFSDTYLYVVMEYLKDFVTLNEFLKNNLSQKEKVELALAIARGVQWLHNPAVRHSQNMGTLKTQKFAHMDIKPGNIMVNSQKRIKIIDLGGMMSEDMVAQKGFTLTATPNYIAPEWDCARAVKTKSFACSLAQRYGKVPLEKFTIEDYMRTDIYALGCVFYKIFTGQSFENIEGFPREIYKKYFFENNPKPIRERQDYEWSPELKNLVFDMVAFQASLRPTIDKVIETLKEINFKKRKREEDDDAENE